VLADTRRCKKGAGSRLKHGAPEEGFSRSHALVPKWRHSCALGFQILFHDRSAPFFSPAPPTISPPILLPFSFSTVGTMTSATAVDEITSVEQFQALLKSAGPTKVVALNFYAPWAEPCKQMNQVFTELSTKYPSVTFAQVLR